MTQGAPERHELDAVRPEGVQHAVHPLGPLLDLRAAGGDEGVGDGGVLEVHPQDAAGEGHAADSDGIARELVHG
ncbi:MAG: hypothetical protein MZV64_31830 [Ignavibacteriales bacterium]|nr:hypothetical protein [Ignavibacteriales bacterium]